MKPVYSMRIRSTGREVRYQPKEYAGNAGLAFKIMWCAPIVHFAYVAVPPLLGGVPMAYPEIIASGVGALAISLIACIYGVGARVVQRLDLLAMHVGAAAAPAPVPAPVVVEVDADSPAGEALIAFVKSATKEA